MQAVQDFISPREIDEAISVLKEKGREAYVIAGGTDVMVRLNRGLIPKEVTTLVSLHRVTELRGVRVDGTEIAIGAATTATDLLRDPSIARHAAIMATVADRMASAQIRNVATVGGNLANASPAGDLISPLLLLDAELVLASTDGRRTVAVAEFFTAPGETVLRQGEIIVEARFEIPPAGRTFRFEKAGRRPAMECSFVTVGLAYTSQQGSLGDVRVAFGSVAPTPLRGLKTEAALEGRKPKAEVVEHALSAASGEISPIDDVRGCGEYRRALIGIFLRRMLEEAAS
jgi:CO/xanthine dehydrogenase FAD-binding subunit